MSNDFIDEIYFDQPRTHETEGFDAALLREPVTVLAAKRAITLGPDATVTDAIRIMQREHRGCVLVTDDGTTRSKLIGIFTERDVLFRIVDKGRNPAALSISEVMTSEPDALPVSATVAYVLNKMSVGGFRHIPVVDDEFRPAALISVRDVVTFLVDSFPREVLNLPPGEPPPQRAREGA